MSAFSKLPALRFLTMTSVYLLSGSNFCLRISVCAWRTSQANGSLAEIPHLQGKEAEISKQEQSERLITEEKPTRQRWAMDEVQVSFVFASFFVCFLLFFPLTQRLESRKESRKTERNNDAEWRRAIKSGHMDDHMVIS